MTGVQGTVTVLPHPALWEGMERCWCDDRHRLTSVNTVDGPACIIGYEHRHLKALGLSHTYTEFSSVHTNVCITLQYDIV